VCAQYRSNKGIRVEEVQEMEGREYIIPARPRVREQLLCCQFTATICVDRLGLVFFLPAWTGAVIDLDERHRVHEHELA
jgi:hypothetical protein